MGEGEMRVFIFSNEQLIPRPVAEVFPFFADPQNLQTITPPWLNFKILTPGRQEMEAGVLIDYRLKVHGIPLLWRSEISVWEPPHRFVDEQRRGPYRVWHHEHIFEDRVDLTLVIDRVRYAVPGGWLINKLFVSGDIERIFAFRRTRLAAIFAD
jgi:hypothetical protein